MRILIPIASFLLLACTHKLDPFSSDQETIRFTQTDSCHFEYTYYSFQLNPSGTESSELVYCKGNYKKISRNVYELYPDNFNPESVGVNIRNAENSSGNQKRIKVKTRLGPDRSDEYQIVLCYNSDSLLFKGTSFDTVINDSIHKFTLKVILPAWYVKGNPSSKYSSITTETIEISEGQCLEIDIPISFDYFYYKNIGTALLKDLGRNYILNQSRKIRKG